VGKQLIPAGLLLTVPVPLPMRWTVSSSFVMAKLAVTGVVPLTVTLHDVAVPQPGTLHPEKEEFAPAVAVRVTWVPLAYWALQVGKQLMPAGVLLTVPVPLTLTINVPSVLETGMNVAVTEELLDTVILQAPVPLQAPPHPAKVEPWPGVAVSVTCVPDWKVAMQVLPQLIPDGLLLMVPVPVPAAWTCNCAELGGVGGVVGELLVPPPQLIINRRELTKPTKAMDFKTGMARNFFLPETRETPTNADFDGIWRIFGCTVWGIGNCGWQPNGLIPFALG
jgi:hypothetical protein